MKTHNFNDDIREIEVPEKLKSNIKKIYISKSSFEQDINEVVANFLVNDDGILDVLAMEKMSWIDWKNLKGSCEHAKSMSIKNNGILMEFLSQNILPKIFNINSLILYQEPNFESPENGNDLLFYDENGNVFVFEVKSKLSKEVGHLELKEKIKNAYTSLFCSKELKNKKKISIARKVTTGLNILDSTRQKLFNLLERIDNVQGEIIELCSESEIFLNICIIGNGFECTDEEVQNDIIDALNSSIYCKAKCKYNDLEKNACTIDILSKSIILNIISIEFNTELNIIDLNNCIIKIIDEKGLDVDVI